MSTTRFKGESGSDRLGVSTISDSDMIQVRHKPGTIDDADKGVSKAVIQSMPFGVCTTSAATGTKVATLVDSNPDFVLVSGREIVVYFQNSNTAANPSLNFEGAGAIPMFYPNGNPVGIWEAGMWIQLKYFEVTIGGSMIQRWIACSPVVSDGHVGDIKAISYVDPPDGWLECNGQAVSRTTYAALFNLFNTQKYDGTNTLLSRYGTGDGSTTFNLPDYREAALVGAGQNASDSIADHDVYTVGQFKNDSLQDHSHTILNTTFGSDEQLSIGTDIGSAGNATGANFAMIAGSTYNNRYSSNFIYKVGGYMGGRATTVTRGKRKAVKYIIKVL